MADLIVSSNILTIAFISFPCNVSIQCLKLNDRCISFTLCKSLWRNTTWNIWIPNEAVESLDPLLCWETYKQWKEYRTESMNEKSSLSEGNWVNPSRTELARAALSGTNWSSTISHIWRCCSALIGREHWYTFWWREQELSWEQARKHPNTF